MQSLCILCPRSWHCWIKAIDPNQCSSSFWGDPDSPATSIVIKMYLCSANSRLGFPSQDRSWGSMEKGWTWWFYRIPDLFESSRELPRCCSCLGNVVHLERRPFFSRTEGYPSRCLIVSAYTCSPLVLMELLQLSLCGWGCCYLCGFQPGRNRTSTWTPVHRALLVTGFPSTLLWLLLLLLLWFELLIYRVSKYANVVRKLKKLQEGSCSMFIKQHFSISLPKPI